MVASRVILIAFASAALTSAFAIPVSQDELSKLQITLPTSADLGTTGDYEIVPVRWRGRLAPEQPETTIVGESIKQIYEYLAGNHPGLITMPVSTSQKWETESKNSSYPSVSTTSPKEMNMELIVT